MSGRRYKEVHTLNYYMCDRNQTLTMPMLVNLLLEVSGQQSGRLGLGEETMTEMGYAWIILQYEFEIQRMPKFLESIEIETFASEYNKLFCYRNFIVRDEQGEEMITVFTTFALLSLEERKISRLPAEILTPYEAEFNKRLKRTARPASLDEEQAIVRSYRTRYFDIDANQHVNNSQYLNWTLDTLGSDFLTTHEIKSGTIKFAKEVYEGQTIESYASIQENSEKILSAHRIQDNDVVNCTASFRWAKIES